jgi:hypothetical protein
MIRLLDINLFYQEQAQYNRFINWRELKDDPLNFRGIWIKVSEGTDGESYVEGASRCRVGAQSVGFEVVFPYHYYLYQYADWSSGAAVWRVISAKDQANAFFVAAVASGFYDGHPMMDWEDPLIRQFLQWSDTASINKAIQFARKLNAHLKSYTYFIRDLFGVLPDAYSGGWWLDLWVPLLINNGYAAEVEWLKELYYILADYDGTLNIPDYIPIDHVIAWQETSSPKPPVKGIPTGRVVPGDALDIDRWMRSDDEFLIWSGQKEQQTMTTLYKTDKPQTTRAKVFEYRADQKYLYDVRDMGIDAVILPMAGMDLWQDGHKKLYSVASFKGRFSQFAAAGIPVIGRVALDGGYWLKEGHTDVEVKSQTALPEMTEPQKVIAIRNNLVLSKVFDAWVDGNWTWDMVFSKQVKWLDIKAIELGMVETEGYGTSIISDLWQTLTFNHVATCLNYLKLRGYIPNIPVILYTGPWFMGPLTNDFRIMLANAKTWLYLHLGQWTLTSTATFNNLGELFAFRPAETFKFSEAPDGYTERIWFHEYTGYTQSVTDLGKVSLSLFQSDKADLDILLGAVIPPIEPPVDPTIAELQAKIKVMEAEYQDALTKISSLMKDVSTLEAQAQTDQVEIDTLKQKLIEWEVWVNQSPKGV